MSRDIHVKIDRVVTITTPALLTSLEQYDEIVRRIRAAKTAREVDEAYGTDPIRRWPGLAWYHAQHDRDAQQALYCLQRDLRLIVRKRIDELDPLPSGATLDPAQGQTRPRVKASS